MIPSFLTIIFSSMSLNSFAFLIPLLFSQLEVCFTIPHILSTYRCADDLCEMSEIGSGLLAFLNTPDVPVSSTVVRELIAKNEHVLPVPPEIAAYIRQHRLYQDTE